MQYQVTTEEGHSVTIAANAQGEAFEATDLKVDLSQATLLVDPLKDIRERQPGGELLHPLAERSRYAFELLSELDPDRISGSPILQALLAFKERRLSPILEEVMNGTSLFDTDPVVLERLAHQPQRAQALLSRIVKEIDSELPGYFRPEKESGVWKWLASGGSLPLAYSVGPELPLSCTPAGQRQQLLTNVTGTHVMFDLTSQTAHMGSGSSPTTNTVLSSLCTSGTLGQEVVDLNRAGLLHLVTNRARRQIEVMAAENPVAAMKEILISKGPFNPMRILTNCLVTGSVATILGVETLTHIIQGTANGIDVVAAAAATFLAQRTGRLLALYSAVKSALSDVAAEKTEELKRQHGSGSSLFLGVFSSALIDHAVSISGGRHHTLLGERTELNWKGAIPSIKYPDLNIMRSETVTIAPNVEVELAPTLEMHLLPIEDFTNVECEIDEIGSRALPELIRAAHIEYGAVVWNTSHALALLHDFTETQGITVDQSFWFDYVRTLETQSGGKLDEKGTHPELSTAFARVTALFGINRATWDTISLALQSASTLERLSQTRKALAIAREAVRQELLP